MSLRELVEQATPGPWAWSQMGVDYAFCGMEEEQEEPGELYREEELHAYLQDRRRKFPTHVLSASGCHGPGYVDVSTQDAALITLAPELADLCSDMAEWIDNDMHSADDNLDGGHALLTRFAALEGRTGKAEA